MTTFGMPDMVETQLYCSQQINIPPNLPSILKRYAKAAIRTQPYDLLVWSAAYFKAIADGVTPPVKLRIEYPPIKTLSGLSPGYLRVLINQLGKEGKVPKKVIREKWSGVCLDREALTNIFKLGRFAGKEVDWLRFIAVAAGTLEENITRTMVLICELMTEEPEGGSAIIPVGMFMSLYRFLAKIDAGPVDPRPRPPSPPPEPEPRQTSIDFKMVSEVSDHSLDSVLKKVAEPSQLSVETKAMSDVQSLTGLMVWPCVSPEDQDVRPALPGPKPSDEGATSEYGVQVWEKPSESKVETKIELVPEGGIKQDETTAAKTTEEELDTTEEEGVGKGEDEKESEESKLPTEGDVIKTYEDTGESITDFKPFAAMIERLDTVTGQGSEEDEDEMGYRAQRDNLLHVTGMPESADDMKRTSSDDISSESKEDMASVVSYGKQALSGDISGASLDGGGVIRQLVAPSVTSVGQPIEHKLSVDELPVILNEDVKEISPPDTDEESMSGEPFWMPVPGIGPVIPQDIIDAVAEYMTCWAERQCGMVMPRNIRHFLCPPLENLVPDTPCFGATEET